MKKSKIWRIKGFEGKFSDDEIIELITRGELKPDYCLSTKDMKKWIKLSDSIYQFYLGKEEKK
jgi:hypothetical protein